MVQIILKGTIMKNLFAVPLLLAASAALGETITFEADGLVKFIRCTQSFAGANCEFIAPAGYGFLNCVALDSENQPLASDTAMGSLGQVIFRELDSTAVAHVICRPAM